MLNPWGPGIEHVPAVYNAVLAANAACNPAVLNNVAPNDVHDISLEVYVAQEQLFG
jgi:hypothetical protein